MVEFLPFLLIVIGWDAVSPGETMALSHSLHPTLEACEAGSVAFLKDRAGAGESYRTFCIPTPTAEEYDRAFERVK